MSPKQRVYEQFFLWGLSHIRNVQTHEFVQKGRNKSCYAVSDLIHVLWSSMFESEFVDNDLCFLNHHAKRFVDECSTRIWGGYPLFCSLILELYDEVPEHRKAELEWEPSIETVELVADHRNRQQSQPHQELTPPA